MMETSPQYRLIPPSLDLLLAEARMILLFVYYEAC